MDERILQQQEDSQQQQSVEVKPPPRPISELLADYGGFEAVVSFIPEAVDLNPNNRASKKIFLTENQFKTQREHLSKEISSWLELLNEDKQSVAEYVDFCIKKKTRYENLLKDNLALTARHIQKLETTYRALDAFFKNSGMDKITNLRLMNVEKYTDEGETDQLTNSDTDGFREIKSILNNAFDRLSLKDNYSIVVLPGYVFKDKQVRDLWAKMAYDNKFLIVTDADNYWGYDELHEHTEQYKDADRELQNTVVTANWLVGRGSESIAGESNPFYIPASSALAGKLYNPELPMSQGAAGEKFGILTDMKGVRLDLMKEEITGLWNNQVIPIVFSDGLVMAYHNTNLYTGANTLLREYPVVRVFDWIKKNLMHYVHEIALEIWDPDISPERLKKTIQDFLNKYKGPGKLFADYKINKDPYQDPISKVVSFGIDITPFFASKNFVITFSADKHSKKCETTE